MDETKEAARKETSGNPTINKRQKNHKDYRIEPSSVGFAVASGQPLSCQALWFKSSLPSI